MKPADLVEKLDAWRVLLEGLIPSSSEARIRIDTVLREMHEAWIEGIREVEAERVAKAQVDAFEREQEATLPAASNPLRIPRSTMRELEPTTFEGEARPRR